MYKFLNRPLAERYVLWLEALESGQYVQGVGALRTARSPNPDDNLDGFCCLGVLCDLATKDGDGKWDAASCGFTCQFRDIHEYGHETHLPPLFRHMMGINEDQSDALITMNDNSVPFKDIAKYIREEVIPHLPDDLPFQG